MRGTGFRKLARREERPSVLSLRSGLSLASVCGLIAAVLWVLSLNAILWLGFLLLGIILFLPEIRLLISKSDDAVPAIQTFLESRILEQSLDQLFDLPLDAGQRTQTSDSAPKRRLIDSFTAWLTLLYVTPMLIVNLGMRRRFFGFEAKLPESLGEKQWEVLWIGCAYFSAYRGNLLGAAVAACITGLLAVSNLLSYFGKPTFGRYSGIPVLMLLRKRLDIKWSLWRGVSIICSFGILYFCLSQFTVAESLSDKSFTRNLTVLDSIYFSTVTAATVGYGDISPCSNAAKLLCIFQIITSFVYVAIVLVCILQVWQAETLKVETRQDRKPFDESRQPDSDWSI